MDERIENILKAINSRDAKVLKILGMAVATGQRELIREVISLWDDLDVIFTMVTNLKEEK